MSEIDFEAILTQDFRWPQKKDRAFRPSPRWEDDASLTPGIEGRFAMMMAGYKLGADLMVKHASQHRSDRDALVFPILFAYRQFLELALKYLISTYGPNSGHEAIWKSHSLSDLWRRFAEVLAHYEEDGPHQPTTGIVRKVVLEFAKVDPGSASFRYPVDSAGEPIELSLARLDLVGLADVIEGVDGYFTGCDGFFDDLRRAGP